MPSDNAEKCFKREFDMTDKKLDKHTLLCYEIYINLDMS